MPYTLMCRPISLCVCRVHSVSLLINGLVSTFLQQQIHSKKKNCWIHLFVYGLCCITGEATGRKCVLEEKKNFRRRRSLFRKLLVLIRTSCFQFRSFRIVCGCILLQGKFTGSTWERGQYGIGSY
jgi:hypothetical protein